MSTVYNTSYKVHVQETTEAEVNNLNIEQGAMQVTDEALYMGFNGENVKVYPQSAAGQGLGWSRYDDGLWTSSNKLPLLQDTEIVLPNNAATAYRSQTGIDYYNSTSLKVLADNLNDTYIMTIVFKYSAPNANQTYLEIHFEGGNGTPYDRIRDTITFPKGNDAAHDYHQVFQYYADSSFVANGSQWRVTAKGGTAQVWDIIYFIQKTQSYA